MPQKVKIEVGAPPRGQRAAKTFPGSHGDPAAKPLLRAALSNPNLPPDLVERAVVFALLSLGKLRTSSNPPWREEVYRHPCTSRHSCVRQMPGGGQVRPCSLLLFILKNAWRLSLLSIVRFGVGGSCAARLCSLVLAFSAKAWNALSPPIRSQK